MIDRMMRTAEVRAVRALCNSSHWLDVKRGLWTRPVKIGLRASAWPESEVVALLDARVAGCSAQEIRDLVRRLEAARGERAPRVGVQRVATVAAGAPA